MPTLAVPKNFLFSLLGKQYSEKDFTDLCFEFGIELDDVTSQKQIFLAEHATDPDRDKRAEALSDEVIYKIDTPANRYDLLSAEGMATALQVFIGATAPPKFKKLPAKLSMTVSKSVTKIRDYIVCAVLRDIKFSPESYNSFIEFQEKLHQGLARRRTLVSVGTHDLDKIKAPFRYTAVPKADISFVPLNQTRTLNCAGEGLAEYYKDDKHIGKFVPIISSYDKYPVVYDANSTILSLPPIINSDFSKISADTKNVFIECTAVDHHKAHIMVNQIVCAFSRYCNDPFTVEAVDVHYEEAPEALKGKATEATPNIDEQQMEVKVSSINSKVGINVSAAEAAQMLKRMMLPATVVSEDVLQVSVPATRCDILHKCDLVEDVAIAYGYEKIVMTETPTRCAGTQTAVGKLTHLLRLEVACAGYTEMLTFSMCSRDEAFKNLRRVDNDVAVHIANPQTMEFQICRPSLLPGTLKTFQHNKSAALPLNLFEVSDVVLLDAAIPSGTRTERHFAALHCGTDSSGFETILGLLEFVMGKIGLRRRMKYTLDSELDAHHYVLRETCTDGAFMPGRALDVILVRDGVEKHIGSLGVLHPEVLINYQIPFPASFVEISIQPFV